MKIELDRDWTEFSCARIARRYGSSSWAATQSRVTLSRASPRTVFVEPTLTNARRLRAALIDGEDNHYGPGIHRRDLPLVLDDARVQALRARLTEARARSAVQVVAERLSDAHAFDDASAKPTNASK